MSEEKFYNAHIHLFTDQDVPDDFLPAGLVKILRTNIGFKIVKGIMKNVVTWFVDEDEVDRYIKFVTIGKLGSQENIFLECRKYYPEGTKFVVLPMDMAFMGAGDVPRNYYLQMEELCSLSKKYPEVIPFFHADPRRKNMSSTLATFQDCIKGIKIYPPLGYFPYDERLDKVYEMCIKNNWPVTSHCSPYNPVHFKGRRKELIELLKASKTPIDTKGKSIKELCSNFTHPKNWEYVAQKYPDLRINLAHFGSEYYWKEYLNDPKPENWLIVIKDMLKKYKNIYSDVSFTMEEMKYFSLLKVLLTDEELRTKILFGSDYYMVETAADERRFGIDLRAYLGEKDFYQIAKINVEKFLKG